MASYGWIDSPEYLRNELNDTVGLVSAIWISQEGTTDDLYFTLEITWQDRPHTKTFRIPLYHETIVALAQLQLLRDSLRSRSQSGAIPLIRVHFSFVHPPGADGERLNEDANVYWVQLLDTGRRGYPIEDFYYRTTPTNWYVTGYPQPSSL